MKQLTFCISLGKYAGFYYYSGYTTRLCLGWMCFTFIPDDIDNILK